MGRGRLLFGLTVFWGAGGLHIASPGRHVVLWLVIRDPNHPRRLAAGPGGVGSGLQAGELKGVHGHSLIFVQGRGFQSKGGPQSSPISTTWEL